MVRLPADISKVVAAASLAERLGVQANTAWGPAAGKVIDEALAAGMGWNNLDLQRREPEDLGDGRLQMKHRSVVRELGPPRHLNGTPASFEHIPAAHPWRVRTPAMRTLTLQDGYLALIGDAPAVLGSDRAMIPAFSSRFAGLAYFHETPIAPLIAAAAYLDGPALVLIDDVWGLNYCHWISDWLPRLSLMGRPRDLRVLTSPLLADYQRETLRACGLEDHQIVPLRPWSVVQARQLITPAHLSDVIHPAFKGSAWALDYLRERLGGPAVLNARPGRRLYISRDDASGRRVLNEEALLGLLQPHGFERVTLAGRTVAEQAALFASAAVVVGLHGAGLTNVIFCAAGARLLELIPRTYGMASFWYLAQGRGVDYASYVAERVQPGSRSQVDDVEIDLADFEARCLPFLLQPSPVQRETA